MRRSIRVLIAGAIASFPAWGPVPPTMARCLTSTPFVMCAAAGMSVIGTTTNSHFVNPSRGIGGSFWLAGSGDATLGAGDDSGGLGRPVVDPTTFGSGDWLSDFLIGDGSSGERCIFWDLFTSGPDGCLGPVSTPLRPEDIVVAVLNDTNGNYGVLSAAGQGGLLDWDVILLSGGGTHAFVPNGFLSSGILLQRGVNPSSLVVQDDVVIVTVPPLAYNYFDDLGGTRYPDPAALHADLYGRQGGAWTALGTGPAGGVVQVDADSDLCWGFSTGEFTPMPGDGVTTGDLGVTCVFIGGATPSQNVDRAAVSKGRGALEFAWHVTAQLDIVGFYVVQIDPTRGTERRLNASPLFRGQNDGTDETYVVEFPRRVVKRPGLFELEMLRQNGSLSTTPFVLE